MKLDRILAVILVLLTGSTAAYAYAEPTLKSQVISLSTQLINFREPAKTNSVQKSTSPKGQVSDNSTVQISDAKPLAQILREKGINSSIPNLRILVDKSAHTLTIYSGSTYLKSYKAAFGDNGLEDKTKSGDHKTPEGTFYVAERSILSPSDKFLGSRWMRLSYPNIEDAERGLKTGLIDQATYNEIVRANNNKEIPPQHTALGGGVGIHGGDENGTNTGSAWTWGCVGLTNQDVNEIYDYISVGTEVIIMP